MITYCAPALIGMGCGSAIEIHAYPAVDVLDSGTDVVANTAPPGPRAGDRLDLDGQRAWNI